jgi:hypothetical protein
LIINDKFHAKPQRKQWRRIQVPIKHCVFAFFAALREIKKPKPEAFQLSDFDF